ncbi:(2Fe-2S) ferredoxin domain-containing protein [Streptomyces fildesensis]|uniref:(2Fe-2S) ferredoxin domain-containing protein n=1 Tax=Streptomyces fildesensis TaxID=375757 RepID=A0ABW8C2H0_9ACTN
MTAPFPTPYAARPCTLVVCRGCCCGNASKHPGTDHQRQLDRLSAAAADSGGRLALRTTECLGPCDQANIVVVQPSAEGRRKGGRAVWIGFATDDGSTDDILAWVASGGPGETEPPASLALQIVSPRRATPLRRRR